MIVESHLTLAWMVTGLAGVDPAERDLLLGDHDYAGGRDAALDGDRVGERLG
jgi:hypothetical protein